MVNSINDKYEDFNTDMLFLQSKEKGRNEY